SEEEARVAAEIGGGAGGHALDVADGAAFARLASEIAAQRGGIDVLVNSAGTITRQTIATMPAADWDRVIAGRSTAPRRSFRICGRGAAERSSISHRSPAAASRSAAAPLTAPRKWGS